jgi:hypothetical protein
MRWDWKYSISLVTSKYVILLYYLSGTPLGDINIHANITYHIMYLISVKIDHTLTVNQKKIHLLRMASVRSWQALSQLNYILMAPLTLWLAAMLISRARNHLCRLERKGEFWLWFRECSGLSNLSCWYASTNDRKALPSDCHETTWIFGTVNIAQPRTGQWPQDQLTVALDLCL